jgi:hypothetical protein
MSYPRELAASDISSDIEQLVRELATRLLAGPSATHAILRDQLMVARIARVTLTGAGLFADFEIPVDAPAVEPLSMIGGEVLINVEGLDAPAGSLIKITDGRLAFVEIYTNGNVGWPDHPRLLSIGEVAPLPIRAQAS